MVGADTLELGDRSRYHRGFPKTPAAGTFKISPSLGDLEDSIRIWGVHLSSSLHRDVGDRLIGAFFLPLQSLSGTLRAAGGGTSATEC